METIWITEDNIEECEDMIPEEVAENIGRQFYNALVVRDDEDGALSAAMVWELQNTENQELENESRLSFIRVKDEDAGALLFSEYKESITESEVTKSTLVLTPEDGKKQSKLLKKQQFELRTEESRDLVVSLEELSELEIVRKRKIPSYIKPVGDLLPRSFRRGIMNCIFYVKRKLLEDLAYLPLSWYDADVSCYVETDEQPEGFLLVHKTATNDLRVEMLAGFGPDIKTALYHLIRHAIISASELYPPETKVILPRRDAVANQLASYFFPKGKGAQVLYGERGEQ